MTFQLGELSERVRLLEKIRQDDGMGGYRDHWRSLKESIWAAIKTEHPRRLREQEARSIANDKKSIARSSYEVVIRYRPSLGGGMALQWNDLILVVTTAPEHDRFRRWTKFCTAVYYKAEVIGDEK